MVKLDHDYQKIIQVENGDIVLDAGAAEGLFSISVINKARQIILVEPNPEYFSSIQKTFMNISKVSYVNKALWNTHGKRKIKLNSWSSTILSSLKEVEIQTDTIDNITMNLGIDKLDFIKMDIEGSEIEALEGAEYTLDNTKKIVVSAYHKRTDLKLNETCYAIEKVLLDKGFTTLVTKDKLVHGWKLE